MNNHKLVIRMGWIERLLGIIFIIVALYIQTIGITVISNDLLLLVLFYLVSLFVGISLLLNGFFYLTNRIIITNEKIYSKVMSKTTMEVKFSKLINLEFNFSRGRLRSYQLIFKTENKYRIEEEVKLNLGRMIFYEKVLQNISNNIIGMIEEITKIEVETNQSSNSSKYLFSKWRWNLSKS